MVTAGGDACCVCGTLSLCGLYIEGARLGHVLQVGLLHGQAARRARRLTEAASDSHQRAALSA